MVYITTNILDNKTKYNLNNICSNFDDTNYENINKKSDNNYIRTFIDNTLLKDYLHNSENFIKEQYSEVNGVIVDFDNSTSWINKITIDTNKNDAFHKDSSDLTLITYLNDGFEGGEFEYIDINRTKQIIHPESNTSILISNKLQHKVKPLMKGVRFSLITFFKFKEKTNNRLI